MSTLLCHRHNQPMGREWLDHSIVMKSMTRTTHSSTAMLRQSCYDDPRKLELNCASVLIARAAADTPILRTP